MTSKIVALHREWMTAAELAEREGVSTRTIYRRLERGEVEARETAEGMRYRLTPTDAPAVTTDAPTDTGAPADSHDTATDATTDRPSAQRTSAPATTDAADAATVTARHDASTVTAVTALADRLAVEAVERGRLQAERDQLAAELEEWQAFALEAVEEVERLRGLLAT